MTTSPLNRVPRSASKRRLTRLAVVAMVGISGAATAQGRDASVDMAQVPQGLLQVAQTEPGAPTNLGAPGGAPQQIPRVNLETPKTWDITLGAGFAAHPEYRGSGKLNLTPVPLAGVTYRDRVFASTTEGVGVYVFRTPSFQAGVSANLDEDTRYHGHNADLRGLPKIKPGTRVSLFARYHLGDFSVEAAVKERIGPVNGVSADIAANYRIRLSPSWSLVVGPSITFATAKLEDAYFGVTQQDSINAARYGNPITAYRPGGGVRDVALNITSNYRLNEHWGIGARADLAVLVSGAGDSPITKQKVQPTLATFVYYKF